MSYFLAFTVTADKTTRADDFLALNRNMFVSSETLSILIKKPELTWHSG